MTDSIGQTGAGVGAWWILFLITGALVALLGLGVTSAGGLLVWAPAA